PIDRRGMPRPEMVNVGLLLEDGSAAGDDDWLPLAGVSADDNYSLTFTSGTTSRPKGVIHRVGSLIQSALAFNRAVGLGPHTRLFHVLPMAYMAGFLNTILCPFLAGGTVVLGPAFNVKLALRFWESPMAHGVNTLWLVPTILATLLKADRSRAGIQYCRQSVETALVGTAALPVTLKDDFEAKYDVPLLESYGLSETLFVTTNTLGDGPVAGAAGRPLPGVDLEVMTDPRADSAAAGGEIMIRAPWLMVGYLDPATGRPDPLEFGAWFASGDYGHLDDEGRLFITGRKKDLIIKGGVNLSPRAVEEVLLEHEAVEEVAVVGRPHDFYGEEPVAVVVLGPGFGLASVEPELKDLCGRNLSDLQAPAAYVAWEALPKSVTGKVQKTVIRRRLAEAAAR
ncbi:MAG: acyl--CoA ligase, partial [Proteobacteria bacterium]|nr:acyl--CoA ligase [Pseudomonadota bacterium]